MSLKDTQKQVDALGTTVDSIVQSVEALDAAVMQQDEKISGLQQSTEDNGAKLGQILEIIMKNQHSMDPAEHDVNEYGESAIIDTGEGPEIVHSQYKDVDAPEFKKKEEDEAFLREKVTIEIQESHDPNAAPIFDISVNGRSMVFVPGRQYTVPRYIVEGLARARPVHYLNQEGFNSRGERVVKNPSRRSLRHPFNVIQDTQRGREWLSAVMSQP